MTLAWMLAALLCTFPREGAKLPATERCHVIGVAEPSARGARRGRLTLNDVEVPVWRTGSWLAMVRVREGTNTLRFAQGTNVLVRTFTVLPPQTPTPSPPKPPRNILEDLRLTVATPRDAPAPGTPHDAIRILVDPGHGGTDSGAFSPAGFREADFNLLQAQAIAASLAKAGFSVTLTRTNDTTVALYDRPRRACSENFDLFIAVHHNACGVAGDPREARHTVTYASNDLGLPLATAVQRHIARVLAPDVPDAGAGEKSLAVCRNPVVPSILLEIDFIDCPEGEEASRDPVRRRKVADAVTLGVLDWLHLKAKESAP